MLHVLFATHAESNPAGIGDPAVLFSKTFGQKRIANDREKGMSTIPLV